jgi:biopolymer transport protein ExbD
MAFNKRRFDNQINAGSMADIAFLLLIFFLVTTTIEMDKGIMVRLPPWKKDSITTPVPPRNLLTVKLNWENKLMVEKEPGDIKKLKDRTKEFIMNPQKSDQLPSSPKKAVISIQNDRGTSYESYLEVYNEIKAAYNELWDEAAQRKYQKNYNLLKNELKTTIRAEIPLIISEAEPTDHN